MSMDHQELTRRVLAALREVPGLRPAAPATRSWLPWDADAMALDFQGGVVEVRLVALRLPVPPLLCEAGAALRDRLRGSPWQDVHLRLVVTELDSRAWTDRTETEGTRATP